MRLRVERRVERFYGGAPLGALLGGDRGEERGGARETDRSGVGVCMPYGEEKANMIFLRLWRHGLAA